MKIDMQSAIRDARRSVRFEAAMQHGFERYSTRTVAHSDPCLTISKDIADDAGGSSDVGAPSQRTSQSSASDDDGGDSGDSDPDRRPRKNHELHKKAALIRFNDLSVYVGFGRSRIYGLIKEGKFPRSIKIGKSARWLVAEIDEWIQREVCARDARLAGGRHA